MLFQRRTHARHPNLYMPLWSKPALPGYFDFTVAIATIHRPATARFKGYFGVFTTLGASQGEHLAYRSVAVIAIAVATVSVLPCFPFLAI